MAANAFAPEQRSVFPHDLRGAHIRNRVVVVLSDSGDRARGKGDTLKPWHMVIALVIAFILGALYPGPVNTLKAKLGGGA